MQIQRRFWADTEAWDGDGQLRLRRACSFGVSAAVHFLALLVLLVSGMIQPVAFEPDARLYSVMLVSDPPVMDRKPVKPVVFPVQRPVVFEEPSALVLPVADQMPLLRPAGSTQADVPSALARPAPALRAFPVAASLPATPRPPRQVQTGGFGDPKGVLGEGRKGAQPNIARAGHFDLPPGPGAGTGIGGSTAIRAVVITNQFGTPAGTDPSAQGGGHGTVRTGGFGDAGAGVPGGKGSGTAAVAVKVTPAEILFKPYPVYTTEARKLRVEGEVLVEVLFPPSGAPQVMRIIRGLGHGLDEAAAGAIAQIKFKPALRDGQPVPSTAVVHVIFRLA